MKDRAKELVRKLGQLRRLAILQLDENRDVIELIDSVVSELNPSQYPCNGESVEFVNSQGCVYSGYAIEAGVRECRNRYFEDDIMPWNEIKDYRVIREQKDLIPHPKEWDKDTEFLILRAHYYTSDNYLNKDEVLETISRAGAEEMHKELK